LTTGKIGQKGSKALTEIAANVADDILFIVSTGKLDFAQQKSKWFKTLEANGNIVQAWEVQRDHLVGWIQSKLPLTSKLTRSLKSCAFAAFLMCVRLCSTSKSSGPKTK
jgi:DNA polymerase-3 subunit delta